MGWMGVERVSRGDGVGGGGGVEGWIDTSLLWQYSTREKMRGGDGVSGISHGLGSKVEGLGVWGLGSAVYIL
jgi:hypothetical protein